MKSNAFNKTLNLGDIKKHFGYRLKLDYQFYSGWADGVCYMTIDNEKIGYFDPYGLMSSVGAHIELCTENYKRFYNHKDFINWYETKDVLND